MKNDQIFTPRNIVKKMLHLIGWSIEKDWQKTIFEPSFGDGAFLRLLVEKIVDYALRHQLSQLELENLLDNIYGVEIDTNYYHKAIELLNKILKNAGYKNYEWPHLRNMDFLTYDWPTKFDYIIGNPPYVRIHDLDLNDRQKIERQCEFVGGNTDLYVAFIELCAKNLSSTGKLCLITPNSWIKNSSQKLLRQYFLNNLLVKEIVDYGSFNVFDGIAVYTAILLLDKETANNNIRYQLMKNYNKTVFVNHVSTTCLSSNQWTFNSKADQQLIESINKRDIKLDSLCKIQYGLATNADKVYIVSEDLIKQHKIESLILRPTIKGSTLTNTKIIFPYEWNNTEQKYYPISEDTLQESYPNAYNYLLSQKSRLDKRDMEKQNTFWYQYARSQGYQTSKATKLVIKQIVANNDIVCQCQIVDDQTLIHSGLYIVPNSDVDINKIKAVLESTDFCRYVKIKGKDMSGGYKSFNTKLIKEYKINKKDIT